ncbi:MAG: tryptophan synthase subunit alpha [Gemmataceae bacterium]
MTSPQRQQGSPLLAPRPGNRMNMNPIDTLFQRLRSQGRRAFIPFLTAGDPDLAATSQLASILSRFGDLLEIGFPYSDPIADGPVIQASYTRVLERGVRVEDIFAAVRKFAVNDTPLAAMVSYSLVHRRGAPAFLEQATAAGFSGAIVPDLPFEESESLSRLAAQRDFKLIHLIAPTTPRERARAIAQRSTGFLYCVSITGITGERDRLPSELLQQLAWLRSQTDLPLCVGFGISRPEHVRTLREVADGVIVGSAFVRHLEKASDQSLDTIASAIGELAKTLAEALNPGEPAA